VPIIAPKKTEKLLKADILFFALAILSRMRLQGKTWLFRGALIAIDVAKIQKWCLAPFWNLVDVKWRAAASAPFCPAEKGVSAFRAVVALNLGSYPFFRSELSPGRHRAQNDFLSHGKGEILDVFAGEPIALVASFETFGKCAVTNRAVGAVEEEIFRKTTLTFNLVRGHAVYLCKTLLELLVVVPVRY